VPPQLALQRHQVQSITASLCHCATVSLCYCVTVSLCHCVTVRHSHGPVGVVARGDLGGVEPLLVARGATVVLVHEEAPPAAAVVRGHHVAVAPSLALVVPTPSHTWGSRPQNFCGTRKQAKQINWRSRRAQAPSPHTLQPSSRDNAAPRGTGHSDSLTPGTTRAPRCTGHSDSITPGTWGPPEALDKVTALLQGQRGAPRCTET